jgi:hypothetical protein
VRRLIVILAVLGAALVVSAASAAPQVTSPPVNFTDPTGDSATAPDIAGIAVTNDDKGLYTFTITLGNVYGDTAGLLLFLNTDANTSTGDPKNDGADYVFADDHGSHSFGLVSWVNSTYQDASDTTASVTVSADEKTLTFAINKSDLGNTTSFDFFAVSAASTDPSSDYDIAPDHSPDFQYTSQTVFSLSTASFKDGTAKAGGTWSVAVGVTRSDTNGPLTTGATIACKASEGSKPLAVASSSFVGSQAVCTFRVPKKPKKSGVHATVTVTADGQSVSKSFTAKTG